MNPELESFLAAHDLDDVLDARHKVTAITAENEAVIRAVLSEWRKPQAVSNLLLYPTLIPEDIRLPTLFRGLYERDVAYYVLAAVVGFQSVAPAKLTDADRQRVLNHILVVVRDGTDVLAQRASLSFQPFANPEDAPLVFGLMEHVDEGIRHNARAWLFYTFQEIGTERLATAARQSGVDEDVQRQVVDEFTEFLANPPKGLANPIFPMYAYIPNRRPTLRERSFSFIKRLFSARHT